MNLFIKGFLLIILLDKDKGSKGRVIFTVFEIFDRTSVFFSKKPKLFLVNLVVRIRWKSNKKYRHHFFLFFSILRVAYDLSSSKGIAEVDFKLIAIGKLTDDLSRSKCIKSRIEGFKFYVGVFNHLLGNDVYSFYDSKY